MPAVKTEGYAGSPHNITRGFNHGTSTAQHTPEPFEWFLFPNQGLRAASIALRGIIRIAGYLPYP